MENEVCCVSISPFGHEFHTHVSRAVFDQGEIPTHRPFIAHAFNLCIITDLGMNIEQMKENGLRIGITPANH